jgi:hypothetical protein
MNGLDIVLFNVISYLGGILSGIYIHHKMSKNKKNNEKKYDVNNKENNKEKEFDVNEKYQSPVLAATAIPSAPPLMNPNFSQNNLQKRITITTE